MRFMSRAYQGETKPMRVVIVGGGFAAVKFAETLRKKEEATSIPSERTARQAPSVAPEEAEQNQESESEEARLAAVEAAVKEGRLLGQKVEGQTR